MAIDENILVEARAIHDALVDRGMHAHAEAVKVIIQNAEEEAAIEDNFGTDRISECLKAVSVLSSTMQRLCENSPLTVEELTCDLQDCLPSLQVINDVEGAPDWLRDRAEQISKNFARLARTLEGQSPSDFVGPRLAARVHDCIRSTGVAGDWKKDS